METTFITIHNLSPEANILYASASIEDILGYQPEDVLNKSCFEFFHPDEIPFARHVHNLSVQMDKAASLYYARVMSRDQGWIQCECVFTIVHDVMIACTSIYRLDAKMIDRARNAPLIRRLFASSPRDPRYHMLEHLSAKFRAPAQASFLEPRAALILNRFTRTLEVMYATDAVESILGVKPHQLIDKGFFTCISQACLPDAIRVMESAKANDSIAYLRFMYSDPRSQEDLDEEMREASASSDSDDGGVKLTSHPMEVDSLNDAYDSPDGGASTLRPRTIQHNSSTTAGASTDLEQDSAQAIFDRPVPLSRSTTTSSLHVEGLTASESVETPAGRRRVRRSVPAFEPVEIEAVVSCTSDGLVVVLRKARPVVPSARIPLFAAPWGADPIRPHVHQFHRQQPFQHGLEAPYLPVGGSSQEDFMVSIRDVAVFAWSLTGINGNIAAYGHGTPGGEAVPPGGLPIWDPYAQPTPGYMPPENQAAGQWSRWTEKTNEPYRNRGNVVPYRHFRQEELLRYQRGYRNGPMGSDRTASMGQGPLNDQIAYAEAARLQEQLQQNILQASESRGQQNYTQGPRGQNKRAHGQYVQGLHGQDEDEDDDQDQGYQGRRGPNDDMNTDQRRFW